MDAHRIEVLDRADDDAVVRPVANHLHLELFPADQAFLDQQFVGWRQIEAALADLFEFVGVVGNAATGAAEREAGADHHREAAAAGQQHDLVLHRQRFFHRMRNTAARRAQADAGHRVLELQAVFRLLDRLFIRADHLDVVLGQHAMLVQIERAIQRGLTTHRRQQSIGPLLGNDLLDHLPGDGFDVGRIGHLRVGHDRRRIAVDEDDTVALFAQRLAGLGAGVVELTGLPDDDRASADDQDRFEVGALRHAGLRQ